MQFKDNQTLHSQIALYLRNQIFGGIYKPGDKLPPIRDFALSCRVNPNTIVKVYNELETDGLIFTERTNGKYVTTDQAFIQEEKTKFIREKTKAFIHSIKDSNFDINKVIAMIKEMKDE